MVQLNDGVGIWFLAEGAYAAGESGATEYAKQVSTGASDLARVNLLAGSIKMKGKVFKRSRLTPPGLALGLGKVVTVGAEFPEIEFSYYGQTAADPWKVIAVGGTRGDEGTSYMFQIACPDPTLDDGTILQYSIYGSQLLSYKVAGAIDASVPPLVTVKFSAYDIVQEGFIQTGALPAGVINEWDDITVTLDADVMAEMKSYDLTITFEYFSPGSGRNSSYDKFKPLIIDKTFELAINFFLDSAALLNDMITLVVNTFTCIWTDGTNTITVTECYVTADNLLEYPGDKVDGIEYNLTASSGNSVYS